MAAVHDPMISRVTRKAYFRPTRSPIRPKKMAPKGRTTNPTANVARYSSNETVSPAGVVALAGAAGLSAVALTDHDTVGGLAEARAAAAEAGVRLVQGCELSCEVGSATMHLLVYFLEDGPGPLQDRLAGLQASRA